jgi:hypothetical protein
MVINRDDVISARPIWQTFLLVSPENRYDLGLPDCGDDMQHVEDWPSLSISPTDHSFASLPERMCLLSGALARWGWLIIWLRRPFGALLLAQQRGVEYKTNRPRSGDHHGS